MPTTNIYYPEHLQLDKILNSQSPISAAMGKPAHDETLFLTTHQSYELWFRQIIIELDKILESLADRQHNYTNIAHCVKLLFRITEIQRVLIQQFDILKTMTASDFLEFRDLLGTSSGAQSYQFKVIEAKLGCYNQKSDSNDLKQFNATHKTLIQSARQSPSLFELLQKWLENFIPSLSPTFNFWPFYKKCVKHYIADKIAALEQTTLLANKKQEISQLLVTQEHLFNSCDPQLHQQLINQHIRYFSHNAFGTALFITLYKHAPVMHLPHRLLDYCIDIEELLLQWRHKHALLAQRMIGSRPGTGGSAGSSFLTASLASMQPYSDFSNLASFLLPQRYLTTPTITVVHEHSINA